MTSLVRSYGSKLCVSITHDDSSGQLLRFRRDFHIPSSRVSKLISLTVETGTVTGIGHFTNKAQSIFNMLTPLSPATVASITGILFLARPGSQSFNVPAIMLGKVYANSLMRILNNRMKVGNGYSEPFLTTTPELTAPSHLSGQDPMTLQQPCSRGDHIPGDPNPEHLEKGTG